MARAAFLAFAFGIGLGAGYVAWGTRKAAKPEASRAPDLGEALRAMPVPPAERGNGRITGTVRDHEGHALKGVPMLAWRIREGKPMPPLDSPPRWGELEDEVRSFIADYWQGRLDTLEAATDDTGAYVIEGVVDGASYYVVAYPAGFEIESGPEGRVSAGANVDFVVRPVVTVLLDVLLPDGRRPLSAEIGYSSERRNGGTAWSAGGPPLRLDPGSVTISAKADDGGVQYDGKVAVDLKAGEGQVPVAIRLQGHPGIHGTVSFTAGDRFEWTEVRAVRVDGPFARGPEALVRERSPFGDQQDGVLSTALDGATYRLDGVTPGQYVVAVVMQDIVRAQKKVSMGEEPVTCDFEVGPLDPKRYVLLRVLGPDATPVPEVEINTAYTLEGGGGSGGGSVYLARPDGSYLVLHHPGGDESSTYHLQVKSKQLGGREVSYGPGKRELEIRFAAPVIVDVSIEDYVEADHHDRFAVLMTPVEEDSNAFFRVYPTPENGKRPGTDGRLTLDGVQPGAYYVILIVNPEERTWIEVGRHRLVLASGRTAATFEVPPFHTLEIDTVGLAAGERIEIRPAGADGSWTRLAREVPRSGNVSFTGLVAGHYEVFAGDGRMKVHVPSNGPVTWAPEPRDWR